MWKFAGPTFHSPGPITRIVKRIMGMVVRIKQSRKNNNNINCSVAFPMPTKYYQITRSDESNGFSDDTTRQQPQHKKFHHYQKQHKTDAGQQQQQHSRQRNTAFSWATNGQPPQDQYSHHQPFAFHDPFKVFDQFFQEFGRSFDTGPTHVHFGSPHHSHGQQQAFAFQDSFSAGTGTNSVYTCDGMGNPSTIIGDGELNFGGSWMHPPLYEPMKAASSYLGTSFSSSSSCFKAGPGGISTSRSTTVRTVNGQCFQETMTERRYPDGRVERQMGGSRTHGGPISWMSGGGTGGFMPGGSLPAGLGGGTPARDDPFRDGLGGTHRQPRKEKRYECIPTGTAVTLTGLLLRPERNGIRGEIQQFDCRSGRYTVILEETEEAMSVNPANLIQHVRVMLHSLQSRPQWNGVRGTIIGWDPSKERYNIYATCLKRAVSLKPGNCILDSGTCGKITGLQSKAIFNDQWGTIIKFNPTNGRYDVQLSEEKIIRLKPENIRV
mmetsp:Transcript_24391/g.69571  ORF Transcript_24391/g.69571 Transcript_24391/m.69571 type:complete len:493 (+) Transcript_24391:1940-3418(+)